jgi:enoyl-CoA hydratase
MNNVLIERHDGVVVARLNRPKSLNALSTELMRELVEGLQPFDRDRSVGCFVLTGSDTVFAAGADIKEMRDQSYMEMFYADFFAGWEAFTALRTPKLAAVAGHALGGGCELAMMCDMIFAADNAQFGQPEIRLGVIPGMGGSQRLTRLVGKSMAMDMVLTGRSLGAEEALRAGLVSRVVPVARLMDEALSAANLIAGYGKASVIVAREAVERALEVSLREGLLFERRTFHALFATEDQKEGMSAFTGKRTAVFNGR